MTWHVFISSVPLSDRISHILNLSGCFITVRISTDDVVYFLIGILTLHTYKLFPKKSKLILSWKRSLELYFESHVGTQIFKDKSSSCFKKINVLSVSIQLVLSSWVQKIKRWAKMVPVFRRFKSRAWEKPEWLYSRETDKHRRKLPREQRK